MYEEFLKENEKIIRLQLRFKCEAHDILIDKS